jgi:hypothetical protein
MRVKTGEEIVRETYDITCDFCDNMRDNVWDGLVHKWLCTICKRDACLSCARHDHRHGGDYLPRYCPECWEIGIHYLKLLEIEQYRHDDKVDDLEKRWFKKAKFEAEQKMK